jgi:hypothetical protein
LHSTENQLVIPSEQIKAQRFEIEACAEQILCVFSGKNFLSVEAFIKFYGWR